MQELNKHKLHVPSVELALIYQLTLSCRRVRPKISTSPALWSSQEPPVHDFSVLARGPFLSWLECGPNGTATSQRTPPLQHSWIFHPKNNRANKGELLGGLRRGDAWGSSSGIPRLLLKIGTWIPGGHLERYMPRKGWITGQL